MQSASFSSWTRTIAAAAMLLAPVSCMAEDSAIFSDDMWGEEPASFLDSTPAYLAKDIAFTVAAPPANDSAETLKELEIVRGYEKGRTPEQLAKIEQENKGVSTDLEFGLGVKISPEMTAAIDDLRAATIHDFDYFLYHQKKAFKRPRPTQLDPHLTTVIPVPSHPAYPSGHAGEFMIVALLFGEIDPANAEFYKKIANDVGVRREIAGVHYPSDTVAGQDLARQVFAALKDVPAYREKLASAQALFKGETQ